MVWTSLYSYSFQKFIFSPQIAIPQIPGLIPPSQIYKFLWCASLHFLGLISVPFRAFHGNIT
jgi:hypothetical protein